MSLPGSPWLCDCMTPISALVAPLPSSSMSKPFNLLLKRTLNLGPTWIIQDNLPPSEPLIQSHLQSPIWGNIHSIWGLGHGYLGDAIQNATPVNNRFPIFQFPFIESMFFFWGGAERGYYEYKINIHKIEFFEFLEQDACFLTSTISYIHQCSRKVGICLLI